MTLRPRWYRFPELALRGTPFRGPPTPDSRPRVGQDRNEGRQRKSRKNAEISRLGQGARGTIGAPAGAEWPATTRAVDAANELVRLGEIRAVQVDKVREGAEGVLVELNVAAIR